MKEASFNTLNPDFNGFLRRAPASLLASVFVTAALFWTMQHLIDGVEIDLQDGATLGQVEFVRIKKEEVINRDREALDKPEVTPPPPVLPRDLGEDLGEHDTFLAIEIDVPSNEAVVGNRFNGAIGEGDYLPLIKVAPIYPQRAIARNIEGFCVVEYTITRQGTIRDPSIIEDQCSSSLFHKASQAAAEKFRYKPRVMNGVAFEVTGVRNKFIFEIED